MDTLTVLNYLTESRDEKNKHIEMIIVSGIVPKLVELLSHDDYEVLKQLIFQMIFITVFVEVVFYQYNMLSLFIIT